MFVKTPLRRLGIKDFNRVPILPGPISHKEGPKDILRCRCIYWIGKVGAEDLSGLRNVVKKECSEFFHEIGPFLWPAVGVGGKERDWLYVPGEVREYPRRLVYEVDRAMMEPMFAELMLRQCEILHLEFRRKQQLLTLDASVARQRLAAGTFILPKVRVGEVMGDASYEDRANPGGLGGLDPSVLGNLGRQWVQETLGSGRGQWNPAKELEQGHKEMNINQDHVQVVSGYGQGGLSTEHDRVPVFSLFEPGDCQTEQAPNPDTLERRNTTSNLGSTFQQKQQPAFAMVMRLQEYVTVRLVFKIVDSEESIYKAIVKEIDRHYIRRAQQVVIQFKAGAAPIGVNLESLTGFEQTWIKVAISLKNILRKEAEVVVLESWAIWKPCMSG